MDGLLNFSAVSFNRIADLVDDLLKYAPTDLSVEKQEAVKELSGEVGPSMVGVYALQDQIRIIQKGDSNLPFSLSQLLGTKSIVRAVTGQISP